MATLEEQISEIRYESRQAATLAAENAIAIVELQKTKPFWKSTGAMGSLGGLVLPLAALVAAKYGVDQQVIDMILAGAGISAGAGVVGRVKATTRIG